MRETPRKGLWIPHPLAGEEKEVKMETPRTLSLRLAAVRVTVLPIITSVYYSVEDEVDYFVQFLLSL